MSRKREEIRNNLICKSRKQTKRIKPIPLSQSSMNRVRIRIEHSSSSIWISFSVHLCKEWEGEVGNTTVAC